MENQPTQPTAEQINAHHVLQVTDNLKRSLDIFRVQVARLKLSPEARAWVFEELTTLAGDYAPTGE